MNWTPQTKAIIDKHNKDFNTSNYSARMKVLGGFDRYVKSLGGVFSKWHGVTTVPKTVTEYQERVEYETGTMAIWGPDYNNGTVYYRWGQGSGSKATPDAFRTSGKGRCASGDLKKILDTPTIVTTNCNYGVDTLLKSLGKNIWSCDYDKVVKNGGKWITKKADLKPGDMVHFWRGSVSKKNWKHIAIVVEVKDGKVWMADFGNRFIKQRNPYHYMPLDKYATAGGEYGSYAWKAVRIFNLIDDTKKPEPEKEEKIVKSPLVAYQNISSKCYGTRTHAIDTITPHCFVGLVTAKSGVNYFKTTDQDASCNYVVGTDAIGLCVPENKGSWCSSSKENDMRAITIECASESKPPYAFPPATYSMLTDLCVDICKRYGKKKLLWLGSKEKTLSYSPKADEMVLTVHRWFAQKACPGDWMMARMSELANTVTKRLNSSEGVPVPRTIRRGNTGKVVSCLQAYLGGLRIDGKFGAKTDKAVKAYQKKKKLLVDGKVGPITWRTIVNEACRRITKGNTGASVRLLQAYLGGLTVDGKFGRKTLEAVKAFQKKKGLTIDGVVGPKTWAVIMETLK